SPTQLFGGSGFSTPPQRFGPAPEPLVLTTTSRLPSGVTLTSDGYQAVGMNPSTRRLSRSTTATATSPDSATERTFPCSLPTRPSGIDPFGPPGTSPTSIVAASLSVFESITDTVSLEALAV